MIKKTERLRIPVEIVEIAKSIVSLADQNDPVATTLSDDLIQFDNAYAGLVNCQVRRYEIVYFPSTSVAEFCPKWYLSFTLDELRRIQKGQLVVCPIWRCEQDCGMKSFSSDFYCPRCDFEHRT